MSASTFFRSILRHQRRLAIMLACLAAFHALVGFLVLPLVLESMIPKRLGGMLGREVSLDRIRTNPYTLAVTIDGFRIKDTDAKPLLAWKRLYVNVDLWPLLRKRLAFRTIDLEQPSVRVVVEKGGRLNFSDILDRLAGQPSPDAPKEAMALYIGHLRMVGARLDFLDRSLSEPFQSTVGPIGFELDHFRTEPDSRSPYAIKGSTEAGETFAWRGTVSTEPLKSSGELELGGLRLAKYAPYYQGQVGFDLREGIAGAKAAYDFEWSGARHALRLMNGSLGLRDVALAQKLGKEPEVTCASIQVGGVEADLLDSSLDIASVSLKDGRLLVRQARDGSLNLQKLFTPPETQPRKDTKPLRLRIRDISLAGFAARLEDLVPARPVALDLGQIAVSLKDFSLDPGQVTPLELSLRIGEKAALEAKGTLAPWKTTGALDLKLADLELPALDSYADPFANLRLSRGKLGLAGQLKFAFTGRKDDGFSYLGNLDISGFEARDSIRNEPFLRWTRLGLSGVDFQSRRPSLALKSVEWTAPEGRLVMAKDGGSNVARALRVEAKGPVASAVPPSPGSQPTVRIARMRIAKGRLSFIDRSVEPNAALLLSEMDGVYTGLSTEAEDATQVDFKGKAGGLAPLSIRGRAMPLRHDKDTDVSIKIEGADLTDFSPYTGKYLGYKTREGKLFLDARVQIKERKLDIEDKVRLDRMYLGDKVDSPDATHLPVKLGLAILRDRKGVIELDVPIDGSLDDPDIHYGKMVWKAIFNVLGKIITSPFTLLSKMFGGGEDLSSISFAPAASLVAPAEQKKLETLVKALAERPELRLELEGATDAADVLALKRRGLDRLLRQLKWNARKVKVPATPEEEVVEPQEREQWVRLAYDNAFPPAQGVKVEPPPLAEAEQRLLDTVKIDPGALQSLAKARNKASIELLLQGGQVDAGRIFEVQGSEAAKAGGAKVFFSLK
ncbi:MAG TPA: DUF748 domain-containing protein [Holophaga sp.]|nr:DUF748 domain-containing protein [Holophaga sp.]HPS67980.1 DUF748 domain-containing protein [Holophaga sp.]